MMEELDHEGLYGEMGDGSVCVWVPMALLWLWLVVDVYLHKLHFCCRMS